MTRKECYAYCKQFSDFAENLKDRYGRNYTNLTTDILVWEINDANKVVENVKKLMNMPLASIQDNQPTSTHINDDKLTSLINLLYKKRIITFEEKNNLLK